MANEEEYLGKERRGSDEQLLDIRSSIGRIASHLESETRFRDWVHEKFDEVKGAIFGNGKKGLVRDMDKVQADVLHLSQDFSEMKNLIKTVIGWALASSISALGLIAFEIVMMVIRRGHP